MLPLYSTSQGPVVGLVGSGRIVVSWLFMLVLSHGLGICSCYGEIVLGFCSLVLSVLGVCSIVGCSFPLDPGKVWQL